MEKKKLNMQQIAKALNVTPITVSRALNDKEGVSEDLKQKIKKFANDAGYQLKEKSARQMNIVLLVAEVFIKTDNKLYIDFYKSILNHLESNNTYGILKILEEREVDDYIVPTLLLNNNIDGIIILGELNTAYIDLLDTLKIPMILLDFYDERLTSDAVINDNFFEAYEITHYLTENGHKDIAFVGNIHSTHSIQDRYLGYYKAMLRAKLPIREDYVISDRTKNGIFNVLILPEKLPTAFVCNCDEIAFKLIEQLKGLNIRVPEDCSVVSFDNSRFSKECIPPITTMTSNLEEMVKVCVNNILKKIESPNIKTGVISVKGSLINRSSVKKIN